jgi:hypothetical protein
MKKRIIPLLFLAGMSFYSQMLKAQTTISNTATSITLFDLFASGCAVNVSAGNYKLTVNYLSGANAVTYTSTGNTAVVSSTLINGITNLFINGSACVPLPNFPNLNSAAQIGFIQLEGGPGGTFFYRHNAGQITCVPLPVTLISFDLSTFNVPTGYSKLIWEIVEYDNSHYIIQKSTDAINFTDYGFEPAVGLYGSQLIYNFVVPNPNVGTTYYYRLKMLDPNGSFTYSPIRQNRGVGTANPTSFCAYTNIEGNASICGSPNVYKVHNASAGGITWSASFGTLSPVSPQGGGGIVTLSSSCPTSNVTISASAPGCGASKILTICNPGAFSITGATNFCTSGTFSTNPVTNVTWSAIQPGSTFSCSNCTSSTLNMTSSGSETITATTVGCNPKSAILSVKNVNYTSFSTTGIHAFCKNATSTISVDQAAYPGLTSFTWGPMPTGWIKVAGGTPSNSITIKAPNSTSPPTTSLSVTASNSICGNSVTSSHFLAVGGPCTSFTILANPITSNTITIIENDDNTGKPVTESNIEAIEIHNKMGFSYYKQHYSNKFSGSKLTIPVGNLPNDLYIIKIYDGFEWKSYKVSVQH